MFLLQFPRWYPLAALIVSIACFPLVSAVYAQVGEEGESLTPPPAPIPLPGEAPVYDEVGTVTSSNLEALGDLSRDAGAATLLRSRAAINLQQAIEEYLENEVDYVKAYYARRAAWRKAQKQERRDPVSAEEAEKIAEARSPDRLSEDFFNPETGEILWPPVLDTEPLKPMRVAIERQFKRRSSPGYEWNPQNAQWVKANVEAMQKAVDTVKQELPVQTYVDISRLLESVAWEAEHDGSGERVEMAAS